MKTHNKLMHLFVTALIVLTTASVQARIIDKENIENMKKHHSLNEWKKKYLYRAKKVLGEDPKSFFSSAAKMSIQSLYNKLNDKYTRSIRSKKSRGSSDIESFLAPMVSNSVEEYGYSQLVLDTALGCTLFKSGSSFKNDLCKSYPRLSLVVLRMISNNLPKKGKTYRSYNDYQRDIVDSGRGLVLVRALNPIYTARKINISSVNNSNWSWGIRRAFQNEFVALSSEIDQSLRDFYIKIMMSYRPSNRSTTSYFNEIYKGLNSAKSQVDYCDVKRKAAKSAIQRCTSNHVAVAFLGKLMMQSMRHSSSNRQSLSSYFSKDISRFKDLINKGILNYQGKYVPSDRYRTSMKKKNTDTATVKNEQDKIRERRGIGYTLLQMRSITLASEILSSYHPSLGLYNYNNQKLTKTLDFMAEVSTRKRYFDSIYFDMEFVKTSKQPTKSRHIDYDGVFAKFEFYKYVGATTEDKRRNWARNYGFFLAANKSVCSSRINRQKYSNLCRTRSEFSNYAHLRNIIPFYRSNMNGVIEGINIGPAQLLYSDI